MSQTLYTVNRKKSLRRKSSAMQIQYITVQYTEHLFEQRHNSVLSTETVTQPVYRGAEPDKDKYC